MSLVTVICALLLLSLVAACHGADTPKNIVGQLGRDISLDCDRHNRSVITWTFKRPGSEKELPVQGSYSMITTSSGKHKLVLHNLSSDNSGTYICSRQEGTESDFEAAAAYVVIVAYPHLYCGNNITTDGVLTTLKSGDSVELTCSVIYYGVSEVGVNMRWKRRDGSVVKSQNFSSNNGLSYNLLQVSVTADAPFFQPHVCELSFYSVQSYGDLASNPPVFVHGNTCSAPSGHVPVVAPGDGLAQLTTADHPSTTVHIETTEKQVPTTQGQRRQEVNNMPSIQTLLYMLCTMLLCALISSVVIGMLYCRHLKKQFSAISRSNFSAELSAAPADVERGDDDLVMKKSQQMVGMEDRPTTATQESLRLSPTDRTASYSKSNTTGRRDKCSQGRQVLGDSCIHTIGNAECLTLNSLESVQYGVDVDLASKAVVDVHDPSTDRTRGRQPSGNGFDQCSSSMSTEGSTGNFDSGTPLLHNDRPIPSHHRSTGRQNKVAARSNQLQSTEHARNPMSDEAGSSMLSNDSRGDHDSTEPLLASQTDRVGGARGAHCLPTSISAAASCSDRQTATLKPPTAKTSQPPYAREVSQEGDLAPSPEDLALREEDNEETNDEDEGD